ncbi:ABC transporter permease [Pseudolabrys sp.]|uniref:ABC transporter permease n=1 Tax=Pseudolabrys sp. TaxID=1960880 RepID=UPI003D141DE9
MKLSAERRWLLGATSIIVVLAVWEMSARLHLFAIKDFPSPTEVAARIVELRTELAIEMMHTLKRAMIGLLLAILTMIPFGVAIGRSRALARVVEPIVELLRPLPTPAIIPLMMLIAGIGDAAKVLVIFYAAAFPILLNAIDGARGLHPSLALAAKSLRLSSFEAAMLVFMPATLPQIMAGVRISVSVSILVSITAEMLLSTDGMGIFLLRSQEHFRLVDGIAGLVVLAFVALAINKIYLAIDYRVLNWRHQTVGARNSPI